MDKRIETIIALAEILKSGRGGYLLRLQQS